MIRRLFVTTVRRPDGSPNVRVNVWIGDQGPVVRRVAELGAHLPVPDAGAVELRPRGRGAVDAVRVLGGAARVVDVDVVGGRPGHGRPRPVGNPVELRRVDVSERRSGYRRREGAREGARGPGEAVARDVVGAHAVVQGLAGRVRLRRRVGGAVRRHVLEHVGEARVGRDLQRVVRRTDQRRPLERDAGSADVRRLDRGRARLLVERLLVPLARELRGDTEPVRPVRIEGRHDDPVELRAGRLVGVGLGAAAGARCVRRAVHVRVVEDVREVRILRHEDVVALGLVDRVPREQRPASASRSC